MEATTETTTGNLYRDGTQPVVAADSARLLPQDLTCSILETCGVGLIVAANDGTKTLIGWDRLVTIELVES